MGKTRLAPSPTGALHLGNARTFLINWLMARQQGHTILLRIEDIDGPRLKSGADREALDDLAWLGLDWDEGPLYQSAELARTPSGHPGVYAAACQALLDSGLAYPCVCTRKETELAASAPHASDGATVYPGTCRNLFPTVQAAIDATGRDPCLRFRLDSGFTTFVDRLRGETRIDHDKLGDFVIQKADGTPSYQLACALDDARSGITEVVRGDDLIESVARQIVLMRALGYASTPTYTHLPLVIGADGRRLAKRHGDTRLATYRDAGVPTGAVLTLLARWCGITPARPVTTAADLVGHFDLDRLSRQPITMTPNDDLELRHFANASPVE